MSRLPRQFKKVQDKALLNAIEAGLELVEAELADAVAPLNGIASGMGTFGYGAQIVVEAENSDLAVEKALELFAATGGIDGVAGRVE